MRIHPYVLLCEQQGSDQTVWGMQADSLFQGQPSLIEPCKIRLKCAQKNFDQSLCHLLFI